MTYLYILVIVISGWVDRSRLFSPWEDEKWFSVFFSWELLSFPFPFTSAGPNFLSGCLSVYLRHRHSLCPLLFPLSGFLLYSLAYLCLYLSACQSVGPVGYFFIMSEDVPPSATATAAAAWCLFSLSVGPKKASIMIKCPSVRASPNLMLID